MSPGEAERYSRQIRFAPVGIDGQARIRQASVCIVGCGALGSFQAEALTRAGIGKLRIIDRDYVDFSNLQRQWLFEESDAEEETPKAVAAVRRLARLNRHVVFDPLVRDLTPSNAEELADDCELILDGTDNLETRYLLNDLSVKLRKPWVYGAAVGSYGIAAAFVPDRGPCFACLYPDPPAGAQPTCDVDGVLASATASVAALQVALALRLIVGWSDFACQIHTMDIWQGTSRQVNAGERDARCRVCGERRFDYLDGKRRSPVSLCGRNAVQLHETGRPLNLKALAARLQNVGAVRVNDFALRLAIPDYDLTLFPDGRAIIKGTTDVGIARSLYAQFVGN